LLLLNSLRLGRELTEMGHLSFLAMESVFRNTGGGLPELPYPQKTRPDQLCPELSGNSS
jgi:hypothetical protein